MTISALLATALTFFLVTNPIGNSPTILALVRQFDFERQKRILFREGLFAVMIALIFQYLAQPFLTLLNVHQYSVTLTGGVILLLTSLTMIFPKKQTVETQILTQEPFIVPIATPLLSGAGVLTIIMLKTKELNNQLLITGAILIAGLGIVGVMVAAPYLQKLLGKRGMLALEQLTGMLLAMMAMALLVKGTFMFVQALGFTK